MQKQHIWIHKSKCGELYADIGFNAWFLSVGAALSAPRLKILDSIPIPLLIPMVFAQRQRRNSAALQALKKEERVWRWYARPICAQDQPWQHYSASSVPTPSDSITSHTSSLNPITADQRCLFHSCREMICLKVIFPQHILRVKRVQFFIVRLYIGAAEDDL